MFDQKSPAAAKEQLITEIVSLERESQPRQRMMAMLEAFRPWDANYVEVFFFWRIFVEDVLFVAVDISCRVIASY